MKKIIFTLSLILLAGIPFHSIAQTQDYKFHSIFIYNFTKYIQWPASHQSGDFVIAVVGNSPISAELEKITGNKVVGSQKIIVKRYKSISEIGDCHILYLPSSSSNNFDEVQAKLKGKPTLVITEKSGMAQKGSGINFVLQDSKWKFELNETATQSAGLKVSKELAQMAINA